MSHNAGEPGVFRGCDPTVRPRVLVAYATKSGSVTDIASCIGDTLAEAGAEVDTAPIARGPSAGTYDAVIVGSGVRMGRWHAAARQWVARNRTNLQSVPVALFTVNPTALDPTKAADIRDYSYTLAQGSGIAPVDIGVFTGWFVPERFGTAERFLLRAMKTPEGDHRNMADVVSWARSLCPSFTERSDSHDWL